MRHRIIATFFILGAAWAGTGLEAEVRSLTDGYGNYQETRFLFQDTQMFGCTGPNIWTRVGRARTLGASLNPRGDVIGDSWPALVDTGQGPHFAWAVWGRREGVDYDLVWSRWTAGGWRMTAWVYPDTPSPGSDQDPDLDVDLSGRPYLTWWRDEGGQGRVYMSLFLVTQWMAAYPVSDFDVDARYPGIVVRPGGEILVTYETAEGIVEQTILFDEPVTITDDIDPLDCISDGGRRYVGESSP